MVIRSLDTKPISDWTDYTAVRRQVDRLQTRLGIQLTEASTRLAELENISMAPFVFSDMDLDRISTAFTHVWGGPLVHLLTKFSPYAELLAQRVEDGTLSLQFQQWFQLYEAKQKEGNAGGRATADYGRFVQRVGLHPEHPMGEQDFLRRLHAIEASKRDSLAFNVVFQRAYVEGFLEYAKFGSGVVEELALEEDEDEVVDFGDLVLDDDLDLDTEDDASFQGDETEGDLEASVFVGDKSLRMQYEARVEEYVRSLNRLVAEIPDVLEIEAGFMHHESGLTEPFWLGSLLKAEGGIDFTQSAAGRAKDLLFIVAAMCLYDDKFDPDRESDFDVFWSDCMDPSGLAVCRAIARALKRLSRTETTLAGRILRSKGKDYDEDAAMDELYARLRFLWEGMGL